MSHICSINGTWFKSKSSLSFCFSLGKSTAWTFWLADLMRTLDFELHSPGKWPLKTYYLIRDIVGHTQQVYHSGVTPVVDQQAKCGTRDCNQGTSYHNNMWSKLKIYYFLTHCHSLIKPQFPICKRGKYKLSLKPQKSPSTECRWNQLTNLPIHWTREMSKNLSGNV